MQSALTVEGKVSNFDIVYAGAYMKRTSHSIADYADYSYFYDKVAGSGASWTNSAGQDHHAAAVGGREERLREIQS
jgi:iron complex outermembrane receptor protein